MKKNQIALTIIFAGCFITASLTTSCVSKKGEQQEQSEGTDHNAKTDSTATAYVCSMHPEVTGKEGDKCSKCGMKLEAANKDKKE
jgi:hypothetical protein